MIVLGFDTATPATAVGLMLADGRALEARDDPPAGQRPGHSTRLLALARELLEQAGLQWHDVQRLAVGVGPGTFTGLRIGVATARGLAQSLGTQLAGVCSLRALAHPLGARDVLAVIDARRGEAFAAAYRAGVELASPRALAPERLAEPLALAGAGEWVAVGDGALRFAATLTALGVEVPPPGDPRHAIRGRAICELGAQSERPNGAVLPSYGRPPDAQPALQGSAR
jgi:tRNA threonylcarbamoyladenosine biosynthesis protein TsaB